MNYRDPNALYLCLDQGGHASRALELQQARHDEQRLLQIVDPAGMGLPPAYNLAALRADRDSLLPRIRIRVGVKTDPVGGLARLVEGAVAKAGFAHALGDEANYLLDTDLQLHDFRDAGGWYWYRGSLRIDLRELPGGKTRGNHRWDIKVSSANPETALQRVRDAVSARLERELRDVIIAFGGAR